MRVRRAQSILLSLAMVSTVCGASQAENAAPASVVKPGGEIQIPPAIGKITVKNAGDPSTAGTPGGIENMLAPGTIQQMPTLPSIQQTPEMIEKVHKLEEEGEKLFLQGMLDKALVKWQEAYGMCLEMKYSEGQGRALTNMCRFFLARGQYVKAKYMGENATEVLAETNDKRDLGKARVALAQAYFGLDNPTWAGQQLQLALKDYADLGNSTAKDSAELTGICGNVLLKMGKFKEAVQFQQASAMHLEQAGEYHASVVKRVGVALLLLNLGLYTAAQEEAQRAYSLASSGSSKNPSSVPVALACLGNCQYTLGEYGKALKTFEQASQAAAKLSASQMPELSRANLELGYAHALIASGYPEPAKQKLEKVLPLFKKLNATLEQAQTYNALGMVEETLENHASAVQYFQQALDLQGILNPRKERLHINVLSNLAIAESRAGKNTDARVHMNSILEMFNRKKKPLKDELLKCRVLSAMGEISLKLADVPAAENYLKQAVTIAEKVQDDASLWRDYTLLAKIPSTAVPPVPVNDTLNSALSHFRSPQAGAFPSPERLVWATTREDLGQQLVAMLAKNGMAPQALLAAEQLKDELFIVEWNRRGGQVKPEDADIYTDLMTKRAHLHIAEDGSTPALAMKEWQAWLERFRALVGQNRKLARLIAPVPTTVEDIMQAVVENKTTVVEYLVGSSSSVVFTMDGSGRLTATVLPVGKSRLKQQIATLIQGQSGQGAEGQADARQILATLYTELIPQSIRKILPNNPDQTIVIVPDGPLFNLPFAALVNEQGQYLVERHTLTMAPSMGVFIDSPPRYTDDLSLVVASSGNPQSGADGYETSQISQVFQPELVTRLVGKDTALSSIQEQARGKAVVHFASKVPLFERNPLDSVLPIAKDEHGKRCTADRLFGLSLPNDLMVWSGSSVYGKDIQGNAVKVFSRGLNYAGVRNVLMSLWAQPEDQRTAELVEFYKSKQAGLNQAQSLRKAQMLALSRDPSPRSWAAFQLFGPGF